MKTEQSAPVDTAMLDLTGQLRYSSLYTCTNIHSKQDKSICTHFIERGEEE
jgi:hypothetical protein